MGNPKLWKVGGVVLFALVLSLALWNCNTTEVAKDTILNLTVADSLSSDKGNYDSILVDLTDSAGKVFRAAIFHGAYVTTEHPDGLHLDLGNNVPAKIIVSITGHRKDGKLLVAEITFNNGKKGDVVMVFSTTPAGINIQPDGPVTLAAQGDSLAVSTQILPVGATGNVVWLSLDTQVVKVRNGFLIPGSAGNTKVTATLENTAFQDSLQVSVTALTRPDSVRLNAHALALTAGGPDTVMQAKVYPDSLQSLGVIWHSSDNTIATVSGTGSVKALAAGTVFITVSPTGFSGVNDTCRITIAPKAPTQPDSLRLIPPTMTLFVGDPDTSLNAQIFAAAFQSLGVVWQSSDTNVATVSLSGKVKAKSPGKTLIRANVTGYVGVFDTCRVTVLLKPTTQPDSIRSNLHTVTLTVGIPDSLIPAKIFPDSFQNLGMVWISGDTAIAKIVNGKVKAVAAGKALLTVYPTGFSGIFDTCRATILPKPVAKPDSVRLNTHAMTLFVGGSDSTLSAKISPDSLAKLGVVWASSDTTLAKVANGKVHAVAAGNLLVTVLPTGFPGTADTCRVTVKKDVPALLVGTDRSVKVGGQLTFNLKVQQEYGGVASLKWDLDGNGAYDDSVPADTAAPTHTYATAGNFKARFYVRDGEGNVDTTSVSVHVGNAPVVIFTTPSGTDTVVNQTPFTLHYTVNGTAFTKSVTLQPGPNPVVIDTTTIDGTGSDSALITLDTTKPASPVFTGTSGSFTTSSQPVWRWTSPTNGGGNGTYHVQLDNNPVVQQDSTSFKPTPLTEGSHTLTLQERDAAGNWSVSVSFVWKVDLTAPAVQITSPIASGRYLTALSNVYVAGTASDALGLRSISYVLTGTTQDSASATGTTAWSFNFTANPGTTTVKVIATDSSGRNTSTTFTLASDQTRPKVTLDSIAADAKITSQNIPVAGSATDSVGVKTVSYSVNNGSAQSLTLSSGRFSFTPACPDGDCSVQVLAVDSAGNRDSQTVVIHLRSNVIFVRKGMTGGDGSSWSKAFGELSDVLDVGKTVAPGKRIWVSEGSYGPNSTFPFFKKCSLMGGFSKLGNQYDESQRTPFITSTVLSNEVVGGSLFQFSGSNGSADSSLVDGIDFEATSENGVYAENVKDLTINSCRFLNTTPINVPVYINQSIDTDGVAKISNSYFKANNVQNANAGAIYVETGIVQIDNCDFESNSGISTNASDAAGAVFSYDGRLTIRASIFKNDIANGTPSSILNEINVRGTGVVDIDSSQITNGRSGISGFGTVNYGTHNTTLSP